MTESNWNRVVLERLHGTDWQRAAADVQPFLEVSVEVDLLREEIVANALKRKT